MLHLLGNFLIFHSTGIEKSLWEYDVGKYNEIIKKQKKKQKPKKQSFKFYNYNKKNTSTFCDSNFDFNEIIENKK